MLSRSHQWHGAPLRSLEDKHYSRAEVELPEEAPLLALETAEAFLLTLPRLPRMLLLRVGAQLGITVDADAADVGGPDRPHREETVLPSARVNHALVEME